MVERIPDLIRRVERVEDRLGTVASELHTLTAVLEDRALQRDAEHHRRDRKLKQAGALFAFLQVALTAATVAHWHLG